MHDKLFFPDPMHGGIFRAALSRLCQPQWALPSSNCRRIVSFSEEKKQYGEDIFQKKNWRKLLHKSSDKIYKRENLLWVAFAEFDSSSV